MASNDLFFVEVWDTHWKRYEDAVIHHCPCCAARVLAERIFPGFDPASDYWRASSDATGQWFGTIGPDENPKEVAE